jgi:hypothetical protein
MLVVVLIFIAVFAVVESYKLKLINSVFSARSYNTALHLNTADFKNGMTFEIGTIL